MSDNGTADRPDTIKDPAQETQEASLPDLDDEIVEAKTAVIVLHSNQCITKNEYIQWRLTSLFQPLAMGEKTEIMEVLYLSHQRKHSWLSDYKNDDSNSVLISAPATPLSPTLKRSALPRTKYVVTPRTNVISIMPECRLVFIVDLSSSLATVGNTKSQILLFEVFRTLRNTLEGLVHPFCLQTTPNERIMLRPTLRLTVLADCSQFASNVNVIPMLEDHPTMRVFLQNVLLNLHTIDTVVADLYDAFRVFQKDTTTHRKHMKKKRASLGYHLDVGEGAIPTYDRSLFDATTQSPRTTSATTAATTAAAAAEEETIGVWGMGKTGANLSRMLHAGAFATSLFDPAHGRAQLILITDGALKAQIQDNTLWRQFAEQDLACHVIQIGFPQSFIPGRNFGFLPDMEILKFLAQATGGTFLYSSECQRLNRPDHDPEEEEEEEKDDKEEPIKEGGQQGQYRRCCNGEDPFITKRTVLMMEEDKEDWWWNLNPNIYHRHFVLRESNLEKIRTLTPFSYFTPASDEVKKDGRQQRRRRHTAAAVQAYSNFPWDPEGTTPPIEWRLLKYRDYALPGDFSHMIAARAREGFYLQSVLFDDDEEQDKEKEQVLKKKKKLQERVQLTLVFHWKPHVIIEYRIRAQWLSLKKETFYSRTRSPSVEIFIRTDAEFAHLVQNSHLLRRRFQMMRAILQQQHQQQQQDPKGIHSLTALSKVEKLKTYLQYLFEGDTVLATLIDPGHQYFSGWDDDKGRMDFEVLKTRFCSFGASRFVSEEDRYQTRCWYDLECVDFLVDPTEVVRRLAEGWAEIALVNNDNQQKDKVEDGTIPSFVKFLGEISTLPQHPSFCKVKIQHDYGRLVTLRCLFFNTTPKIRQGVKNELCVLLKDTFVCARPFSSLLIRDQAHFVVAAAEEEEEKEKEEEKEEEEKEKQGTVESRWQRDQRLRLEKKRSWYMPVGLWLTGEHIVHDYLWCAHWSWPTDIDYDQGLVPVQDLAFEFLCQARIEQSYQLVLARPENTHFYQELQHRQRPHAIQYFIRKEVDGRIQTELWVEPSVGQKYYEDDSNYDAIQSWTSRQDCKIISHLVTFDQIHAMGSGCYPAILSNLFDVSLVLKPNPFLVVSHTLPRIGEFHRYFESVARKVMDAEIEMSGASSLVWRMLRKALRQYDETRVTEMLCFVQIVDLERFFLLVIPPHRLDCLVFACTRMTIEEAPILLSILKDESEVEVKEQGGAFAPPRATSCFLKDAVLDQVKMIHGKAFLETVYTSLLPTRQVWEGDLDQALSVCQTTLISIDLTTFVSTLQKNTCGDEMEMKWKLAWSPYFDTITTVSDDDDKKIPANVLLYIPTSHHTPENPLFLGVSCTSELHHPTLQNPMSFTELKSTLRANIPSQPSFLATANQEPIQLNLICQSDGPLTEEQNQVLNQTVARLDWMFTEQVLRQALSESPTQAVLQYVETQLNKHVQNPWTLSFRFVMMTNGRQVFMDLLEKMDDIGRQDEYFFVTGTTMYWLLIVVHMNHLQMYYYNFSSEEHDSFVENMKERIGQMEKQANQTLLLAKLQATRNCSKYLEVPDQAMSPKSDDSGSSQDTTGATSEEDVFGVGELQCPEIYHRMFPVHWRVPSHKVLSYLKNDVLSPFLVTNRTQMYVIEREHTVVYCHFREKSIEGGYALEMSVRGLERPLWIERDVVPLIENRITNEVTLVEIQTFFARNPSNKPTSADVDFILPFEKQVPLTETFSLPMTTDLPKLFRFLKRFLSSHLLRSFQGPQVVATLDTHLTFSTGNSKRDRLEKDELCFYYNCTKRIPGVSSAIEVACGQGMAGLLMTIRDTVTCSILTEFPCTDQAQSFDPNQIRQIMEKDLRNEGHQGRYVLQVDIWTRGAVEGQVLLEHIHNCFCRSVCDTLIEQTVSLDLTTRSPRGLRDKFIETVIYLLTKSVECNSPTVQTLKEETGLDPWCITEMLQGLKDELVRLDMALDPTMMWRKLDNNGNEEEEEWRLFRGRSRRSVGDNVRMVIVSGLSEFIGQFSGPLPPRLSWNSKDHRSSLKSIPPSRKNSIPQPGSTTTSLRSHPTPRSRAPSSSSSISSTTSSLLLAMNEDEDVSLHPLGGGSSLVPQADTEKHCFMIMTIDPYQLTLYAYNWAEPHRTRFFQKIWTLSQYQRLRAGLLHNILNQKMGLFHHSESIQALADQFILASTPTEEPSCRSAEEDEEEPRHRPELKKSVSGLKVTTKAPQQQQQQRETMSIQHIIRKPNLAPSSMPSTPTSMKTPASDRRKEGGSSSTRTTMSQASPVKKPSIASSTCDEDKKRSPRRRVSTRKEEMDLLSMDNPELNQVLLGAISDPVEGEGKKEEEDGDDDMLWRHGEPFLTTYLQQARLSSVHRKARQVYTKWRQRFTNTHYQLQEEEEEGLTRYEVASILRSSRLLHFCRAPFFLFTDLSRHRSMFITQYARYLEKLNMQRVQFTTSEEEEEEEEEQEEEPRSTFLLKVFDAGSILCEIRFTRTFVSVTLYGLHRDTGGSQKTTSKKTRRRDFQMFEKNVAQLKHLIHINSFVYDFHLVYLQQQLSEGGGASGVLPALHRFGAYYTTPTPYSTNRLFSGVYQVVSADLDPVFATLVKEQARFGLQPLGEDEGEVAMRVIDVQDLNVTQQGDIEKGVGVEEGWKYSLVLCPLQTERHCLYIRYFVLVVHLVERTPSGLVKNVWSVGGQACVLVNARKKIDAIVSKVIKTCHERSDWDRLVSALNGSQFSRCRGLLHKFCHVSLLKDETEPDLVRLVGVIRQYQSNEAVFDMFERMYQRHCVQVVESNQRHLLLFPRVPPSSTADHLIHIRIDENGVDIWLVRRDSSLRLSEPKDNDPHTTTTTTSEKQLVNLLGQGICYILWKLSQ